MFSKKINYKYSMIIPAYNAEKTIRRCLESVISQKRTDVQIIVINDGSTDDTAKIIEEYSEITCISQENKGVSSARNRGLDVVEGRFVLFLDSDDFLSPDYFEKLDLMDEKCDICYFERKVLSGKPLAERELYDQVNQCSDWLEKMRLLLASREIMQLYNKRFKREIIEKNHFRFVEYLYSSEDFNFCLAYSMCCQNIQMYQEQIYINDLSNQESLSRKARHDLAEQLVYGFNSARDIISTSGHSESEKQKLLTELDYLYAKSACSCIAETFKFGNVKYLENRAKYFAICEKFQKRLGNSEYKNITHHFLRWFMDHKMIWPIYFITWVKKGK